MTSADELEKPVSGRIGRWVLDDESTRYGEAGWHLDGGPIVLDWMPACEEGCGPDTFGDEHYDSAGSCTGGRAGSRPSRSTATCLPRWHGSRKSGRAMIGRGFPGRGL